MQAKHLLGLVCFLAACDRDVVGGSSFSPFDAAVDATDAQRPIGDANKLPMDAAAVDAQRPVGDASRSPDASCAMNCGGDKPEDCTNGIDDDRDGLVDCHDPDCASPTCVCNRNETRGCASVGICGGTQTCAAGIWGECAGARTPQPEICANLVDDDCNGRVDDGCVCTKLSCSGLSALPGAGSDPAAGHLPNLCHCPVEGADTSLAPGLGIITSRRHLLVALNDDATLSDADDVLAWSGCVLVGTLPKAKVLQLLCPNEW